MDDPRAALELGPNSAEVKGELGVKDLILMPPSTRRGWITRCRGLAVSERAGESTRHGGSATTTGRYTARGLRWQELSVAQVRVEGALNPPIRSPGNSTYALSKSRARCEYQPRHSECQRQRKAARLQLRIQGEPVSGQLNLAGSLIAKKNAGREHLAIRASRRRRSVVADPRYCAGLPQ